jgi:hypothetical protein
MGSREVGALETMERVLVALRPLRDGADDAIRRLVDQIERDQAYLLALITAAQATRREPPALRRPLAE